MNERIADQRLLRGTAATIESRKLDGNGEPMAAVGAVTVTVTTADGTAVISAQAATSDATTTGRYTRALTPAQNATLNVLTCVWSDAGDSTTWTTIVDVVGGFYFSLGEARSSDTVLADTTKYPDALVLAARREVEDEFEEICGVSFVPRYTRVTLDGVTGPTLILPHPHTRSVRTARVYSDLGASEYTALTVSELASLSVDGSIVTRTDGGSWWARAGSVVLEVEHGHDRPPSEVKRAALTRLRHRLNFTKTGIPDRAQSFTVAEGGTFSLASAGARKTGIPEVDAVLARYSERVPGLA